MNDVVAVILAGGAGRRMSILTEECCKPALAFAGKYRIVDFALSNCANSGIRWVGLLAQYQPRVLLDYVGNGEPWGLDHKPGGLTVLQPSVGRRGGCWYRGTADAVLQNLDYVEESGARDVLVLGGAQVGQNDFRPLIEFHRKAGADCTVGVPDTPSAPGRQHGLVSLGASGDESCDEKAAAVPHVAAPAGIIVFRREALRAVLQAAAGQVRKGLDLGTDLVRGMMARDAVRWFRFHGYSRDITTVAAYYEAHQSLLYESAELLLGRCESAIRMRVEARPPVRFGPHAWATDSLICEGAAIEGEVRHSVISPGARVSEGALVEDSIILHDATVAPGAAVRRCIVDAEAWIGPGAVVGGTGEMTPSRDEPTVLWSGTTLVGRRARVPGEARIGWNCKVAPGAQERDFQSRILPSGDSVYPERLTYLWVG